MSRLAFKAVSSRDLNTLITKAYIYIDCDYHYDKGLPLNRSKSRQLAYKLHAIILYSLGLSPADRPLNTLTNTVLHKLASC